MQEVVMNESKSEALQATFFPGLMCSESEQEEYDYDYLAPKFKFKMITNDQIRQAILHLGPHKAPGPDGIANVVIMQCSDLLIPHLGPVYHVTFRLGVYPTQWKDSVTIVLRKLAKPDYTVPGTHRPIALLNTITKVLSTCVAEDLGQMAEVHRLLPDNHFGCHPGRTTTDSLHFVTKFVKDAWRKREVVSTLFLDVKSVFLNMLLN